MYLCFGTFAKILYYCQRQQQQDVLVARLARCVDPHSSYIENSDRFKEGWEINGDKAAASKLLACKRNFVLQEKRDVDDHMKKEIVENFKMGVSPLIDEDKKKNAIFALLHVIQMDDTISGKNRRCFKRFFDIDKEQLLKKSDIYFCDFLGRALLYVVYGDMDNVNGKASVEKINADYIENLINRYQYEIEWDLKNQKLFLQHAKIVNDFLSAISEYYIITFLKEVDPVVMTDSKYIEMCEDFIKYINAKIPIKPEKHIELVQDKINRFVKELNNYIDYLALSVIPNPTKSSVFYVPRHRDEAPEWELEFEEKTKKYRQKLIDICSQIILYTYHF